MTDLERAYAFMEGHISCQLTICSCVTSCGCAAEIAALIAAARREGAEEMRERAAQLCDLEAPWLGLGEDIRALPLTPEEPA